MKKNTFQYHHFTGTKLVNVLAVAVPFFVVWFLYYEPHTVTAHFVQTNALVLMGYCSVFFHLTRKLDGFRVSISQIRDLVFSQIISVGVTDALAAIIIWMLSSGFPNLLPGLLCFAVQCGVCALCANWAHKFFFMTHEPYNAVVIYDVRCGMEELVGAYGMEKRFDVKQVYPVEAVLANMELLRDAGAVFLCGVHSHDRNTILKYCVEERKAVYLIPRVGDLLVGAAERVHMFHLPMLRAYRYNPEPGFQVIKRAFDIVVSAVGLVVLSPVFLVVGLLIKRDGGPAFYKQVRLTQNGRTFQILKFRSMCVDAEKYSGAVLSGGENDPRITKIGRIIRAFRIDEIPQLWNVFVGDMSIVGPRPERPEIAAEYEKELPEFRLRLQAKAGLTGYAQVYGKYNTTPYDKLLMDLMYIAAPSLLEDLIIIMATLKILFSKESTEGVGEGRDALPYVGKRENETEKVSSAAKDPYSLRLQ